MRTPKFLVALMGLAELLFASPAAKASATIAGANAATTLITGADLDVGGLYVPAGTYSIYVLVENPASWQLIVNRQTGQGGHIYNRRMDLGGWL